MVCRIDAIATDTTFDVIYYIFDKEKNSCTKFTTKGYNWNPVSQ